ncbi:GTPase ObgE [candidate division WOR-3 bacterium]|nr:GTPase ObgE [candidate division WOR-3 bacterium]
MFLDQIRIRVEGGKGGDGCVSFRREKYVPRGGPDGGEGGKGGDVILEACENLNSLYHLYYTPYLKAKHGGHGKGKNSRGKDRENLIVKVPPGTIVYEQNDSKKLLIDLNLGDSFIVAKGGKGGRGNTAFKSSTNRVPRIRELGEEGEKKTLLLELKLIADVGFVGYPNAGKSTLLARISNAKPKIASYPFTTLTPNLGVRYINNQKVTFADIPGIIEDAHKGKGLGLDFLRHIERTGILIFILDITKNPLSDYKTLKNEIKEHNPFILKKPQVIVLNKIDLIKKKIPIEDAIYISALKGDGIENLLSRLKEKLK